jgi:acetoin utilization deacetylase AcuC-like enzyme
VDVVVASHPAALEHDTGPNHPERPDRVRAVLAGIRDSGLVVDEIESPAVERSRLALVHDPSYIEMISAFCSLGGGALDMDTFASEASWEAALTAAGGILALVETLETRSGATGFAVTRPPGHHALRDRAMGFCLFNNVAVSAAYLRSRGERVAILDWDVHHGNGTQEMLADDAGTLYVSIHQGHFYPFAGDVEDIEAGDAKGTVINVPLPAGTSGDVYRRAWSEVALAVVAQFEPDWVLVSAGYDAHVNDPLADLRLQAADYGWMASKLADVHPPERTIFALEGGYDLTALYESAQATVQGAAGDPGGPPADLHSPDQATMALIDATDAVARHWRL